MKVDVPKRTGETGQYTQINIMFPSSEVELPPADRLNAFSPEAQKAILAGFEREQAERHSWLKIQQANDHALNMQAHRFFFWWRLSGTLIAGTLAIVTIILGAWLVSKGASATGVAMMLTAAATLIGTAVYGHAVAAKDKPAEKTQEKEK